MTTTIEVGRPEMGISHADFKRIFPRLVADADYVTNTLENTITWADGRFLRVIVSPEQIRKIALLRIPYVNITFVFQGFSPDGTESFMLRFDRAFQKGGG